MAESSIASQVKEFFNETPINGTRKTPATPEGMVLAYSGLIIMALFPIFIGSLRSESYRKKQMESGKKMDIIKKDDAAYFPLIASVALFTLFFLFKFFPKELVNLLMTLYFFVLGVCTLAHLASPILTPLVPASIPNIPFNLRFEKGAADQKVDLIKYSFTSYDIVSYIICSIIGGWYLWQKHWIANNIFGLAFSICGVEMLQLNNLVTGCILLGGLFFYDIFWVFGTNVMVTVASSFEAPIKLVFPQDLLEKGFSAGNFAMLGLGDIVIPGIFIAFLLRFDNSLNRNTKTYFYSTFVAYLVGLLATIAVMHVFKHAQPALLYLVPACIVTPLAVSVIKGETRALFAYESHVESEPSATSSASSSTTPKVEKKNK